MPRNPSEAKAWRMAGYRRLAALHPEHLDAVHHDQTARLALARTELAAIISRWKEVQHTVDTLSVTTQEIQQVLLEKRSGGNGG